jgi:hypothetical protein
MEVAGKGQGCDTHTHTHTRNPFARPTQKPQAHSPKHLKSPVLRLANLREKYSAAAWRHRAAFSNVNVAGSNGY